MVSASVFMAGSDLNSTGYTFTSLRRSIFHIRDLQKKNGTESSSLTSLGSMNSQSNSLTDGYLLRIHINEMFITLRIPVDFLMEDVLRLACAKQRLDDSKFTLLTQNGCSLDLDRTLRQHLQAPSSMTSELYVKEAKKTFHSISIFESGKEVIFLQRPTLSLAMAASRKFTA